MALGSPELLQQCWKPARSPEGIQVLGTQSTTLQISPATSSHPWRGSAMSKPRTHFLAPFCTLPCNMGKVNLGLKSVLSLPSLYIGTSKEWLFSCKVFSALRWKKGGPLCFWLRVCNTTAFSGLWFHEQNYWSYTHHTCSWISCSPDTFHKGTFKARWHQWSLLSIL